MNVFEHVIIIKFIPNHTSCFHILKEQHICVKTLTTFHIEIDFLTQNVKHKSLVTLTMVPINLLARMKLKSKIIFNINIVNFLVIHVVRNFHGHHIFFKWMNYKKRMNS